MVTALLTGDDSDKKTLILGLTIDDIVRLLQGRAAAISGKAWGDDTMNISVMCRKSEDDIKKLLQDIAGPERYHEQGLPENAS